MDGRYLVGLSAVVVLAGACGGAAGASESGAETDGTSDSSAAGSSGETTVDGGASDGSSTASSGGSDASASAAATSGSSGAGATTGGTTGDDPKFDLAPGDDVPTDDCGGVIGVPDFSYLWVANSAQGTISKIETVSAVELGRYYVRPDGAGDPSRTSVNLAGDVVVASRDGGVTKLFARESDCVDDNGIPGIQTAQGAEMLPWDEEECVAWHTPLEFSTQRPIAWTAGDFDEETCLFENPMVWTVGAEVGESGTMRALRLDGASGEIDAVVGLPEVPVGSFGAYGGAVDGEDDFWFIARDIEPYPLVRIDGETLEVSQWEVPAPLVPYGMAIDGSGRVWIASYQHGVARFDPADEAWSVAEGPVGTGVQVDAEERVWIAYPSAGPPGVFALDVESMALVDVVDLPAKVKGVSIDFAGNVWAVGVEDSAFRIDPQTHELAVVGGLVAPYTYSDMTGWGLTSVVRPPG